MAIQDTTAYRGDRWPRERRGAALHGDRIGASRSDAGGLTHRGARARPKVVTDVPARTLNAWRRWGYRLLSGELYSYVLHLRPAEWPIMAGHTLLGYVLAVGVHGAGRGEQVGAALRASVIWVG